MLKFTELCSLEDINRHIFKFTNFDHVNYHPVTSEMELYPTSWNQKSYVAATVILSLLFKPNASALRLQNTVPSKLFIYFPQTLIEGAEFKEDYPTFRDRNEIHFVTCVPNGLTALSLKELTSSFDAMTWLFIFVSALVITIVIIAARRVRRIRLYTYHQVTFLYRIEFGWLNPCPKYI